MQSRTGARLGPRNRNRPSSSRSPRAAADAQGAGLPVPGPGFVSFLVSYKGLTTAAVSAVVTAPCIANPQRLHDDRLEPIG